MVYDKRSANGLPALRCSATARQNRNPLIPREIYARFYVVFGFRNDHAKWFDLVDRCVGCVASQRKRVAENVALNSGRKTVEVWIPWDTGHHIKAV